MDVYLIIDLPNHDFPESASALASVAACSHQFLGVQDLKNDVLFCECFYKCNLQIHPAICGNQKSSVAGAPLQLDDHALANQRIEEWFGIDRAHGAAASHLLVLVVLLHCCRKWIMIDRSIIVLSARQLMCKEKVQKIFETIGFAQSRMYDNQIKAKRLVEISIDD